MNKQTKFSYKYVFILFIIFMFLFSNCKVYAEQCTENGRTYNYVSSDDGTDGPNASTLQFKLTGFGGYRMHSGVTADQCTTANTPHGWAEYEKDGYRYVVLAAATHEHLQNNLGRADEYWFWGKKFEHIHYFRLWETIQFKFVDEGFDSNVYNAIILDSCGVSMFPQLSRYGYEDEVNILDVYFGRDGETNSAVYGITGRDVYVTTTGVFSQQAGSNRGRRTLGEIFLGALKSLFTMGGDVIQMLLNSVNTGNTFGDKIEYEKSEILADADLNNEIQVVDAANADTTTVDLSNITKDINISNTITNSSGQTETVYTEATKIPVMPVDAYSSSIDIIDILDIDFFDPSDNQDSFWRQIRNFVSATSHIVLYLAVAGLLTMLIVRSIVFVTSIFNDHPRRAARSRNIMDRFVGAVILIIVIYLIMTGMEYLYSQILNVILDGNLQKYTIRVNVENTYSFNTNLIGYIKYLTLSSNLISSFGYSIIYFLFEILNGIWFLFMFARMIIIAIFVIIAPITAIIHMTNFAPTRGFSIGNIFHFRYWLTLYVSLVWIPIVMVIIQKVSIFLA